MDDPKLPAPRRKPRAEHSVSFRAPFFEGRASGHGIYVLPALLLIVMLVKYLLWS